MTKFYRCYNNSIAAIVTEETYQEIQRRVELVREAEREGYPRPELPPAQPIFTFTDLRRLPHMKGWVTGDVTLMEKLLEGHEVERASFYVPFSNGYEMGIHGEELAEFEAKFRTTLGEAIEAFGLARRDETIHLTRRVLGK